MALESIGTSDVRLLQRIAGRDHAAIGDLYDRHSRVLFGVIMRILRNRFEAEDVLQEVFVRVWTRAEMYDTRLGSPGAWLARVARNRAIDCLRARRAGRAVEVPPAPGSDAPRDMVAASSPTPEVLTLTAETGETVRDALASLPAEQRALIEAAFFDGYTHSELAHGFGLPLGTVKTRIRTGMARMRERLDQTV